MLDGIQRQLSITFGDYFEELQLHPWQIATAILDIIIVIFLKTFHYKYNFNYRISS